MSRKEAQNSQMKKIGKIPFVRLVRFCGIRFVACLKPGG